MVLFPGSDCISDILGRTLKQAQYSSTDVTTPVQYVDPFRISNLANNSHRISHGQAGKHLAEVKP